MSNKRLFTFGCSFTNYRWSTWADCLAPEFDYYENWGQSGAGNHYIFNSIIEADLRNQFNSGDTIVVCWTDIMREDRYIKKWQTLGNIIHTPIYLKEYITETIVPRGCLIRDLAFIQATKLLFESRPGIVWKFLSMCPITYESLWDTDNLENIQDVINLYQDAINSIQPSFQNILRPLGWGGPYPGWCEKNRNSDPHPNPVEHLKYLDSILPGWVIKEETRTEMLLETKLLEENKYKLENHRPRRSGMCKLKRL
jgi:hypothetical protein